MRLDPYKFNQTQADLIAHEESAGQQWQDEQARGAQPVAKHYAGMHDQSTHGNWSMTGAAGSLTELKTLVARGPTGLNDPDYYAHCGDLLKKYALGKYGQHIREADRLQLEHAKLDKLLLSTQEEIWDIDGQVIMGQVTEAEVKEKLDKLLVEEGALQDSKQQAYDEWRAHLSMRPVSDVYRQALADIRPMGGDLKAKQFIRTDYGFVPMADDVSEKADMVREQAAFYPTAWLEEANKGGGLIVEEGYGYHGRSCMYESEGRMVLTPDATDETARHELAHYLEGTVPGLKGAMGHLLSERTDGVTATPLGPPYEADEMFKKDSFATEYMSKQYTNGSTEILSVGMGQILDSIELQQKDPEGFRYILGVLAGYRHVSLAELQAQEAKR
jgi:hypothetical protein